MKQTLSLISDYSLDHAVHGINNVLQDLREELGDKRFGNDLYAKLLEVSTALDMEYMSRQRKKAGI